MKDYTQIADYMLSQLDGLDGEGPTRLANVTLANSIDALRRFDAADTFLSETFVKARKQLRRSKGLKVSNS